MNELCSKIVYRTRYLMSENNVLSEQVIKETGLSPYEFKLLATTGEVDIHSLVSVADYFGCSLDYLLGRSNEYSQF